MNRKNKTTTAKKRWRRPPFKNQEERRPERYDLKTFQEQLQRLTQQQERLYYRDLTSPQYLGPSKDVQLLRLPGDIQTLRDIQRDLQYIQTQLLRKQEPLPPSQGVLPSQAICTKEIDDIMATRKNELKTVVRRVDRPLVQLRDNTLKWPKRLHKGQPFKDVPLYS